MLSGNNDKNSKEIPSIVLNGTSQRITPYQNYMEVSASRRPLFALLFLAYSLLFVCL